MPASVSGSSAAAVQVYQAFNGIAPGNPLYNSYLSVIASSGDVAFAQAFGAAYSGVSDATLASTILGNLGINTTVVNTLSYNALNSALQQFFAAFPESRGIVVLNLTKILPTLESDAVFGVAASNYNVTTTTGFNYASSSINTLPQSGAGTTTALTTNAGEVLNGTPGDDIFNAGLAYNASSGTLLQTLQSGDSVFGSTGTDTLYATLINGGVVRPAGLTSVEIINATVTTTASTLDMTNASGLTTFSLVNSSAPLTLLNLPLLANLNISASTVGVSVVSNTTAIAGTTDTIALGLTQVTGSAAGVSLTGYEIINLSSNGTVTNVLATFDDTSLRVLNVSGPANVTISDGTGVSTTTLTTINASAATGAVSFGSATTSLSATSSSITGGSGNDTFFFGANYSNTDTLNGGAGTDTISMTAAMAGGISAAQTNLSNLETLSISNATTATTYTPSAFGGATNLALPVSSNGAITVNYLTGTSGFITTAGQALTGARTINVGGSAITDTLNFTIGSPTAAGTNNNGATTFNGVENLNIISNGTSVNTLGTLTMTATAATEALRVSGNAALSVGAVTADLIDASASTGGLVMTALSVAASGITITGSIAADTLYGSANVDIISGGGGNDYIQGGAVDGANQADILTGGAGNDTFSFRGSNNINFSRDSAGTTAITRITDFQAGVDKFQFIDGSASAITINTAQTIATAADLTGVYAGIAAIGASTTTLQAVVVTVSGGAAAGTYLYVNDATGAVSNVNDMLINITGLSGTLTSTDFIFS